MALRLEPGARIVVATHNAGKAREIAALLDHRFDLVTAGALGLPEPEETEATFVGNAVLKARTAAAASGLPALADDSGLCAQALAGAPGVLSARWAGPTRDFDLAMARLRREWEATRSGDDRAEFVCALAVAWPGGALGGAVAAVEGRVAGRLVFPGRGGRGFGYDPVFRLEGSPLTFGEMEPQAKHDASHRAEAFARLKAALW